ncbi:uncharacterized protein LOC112046816 [Bicyclus anynana]|uniref:Uncharacterized protein LOC112046816 n=1 Tax=Bicyclus anynana TaxID=110368 RepID=A0A6J1MUP0_BICAN|nr:uncharacterized protein LOC112046816 [Bicyclus anynana]
MSRKMECGSGCGRVLTEKSLMICRLCKQTYHCECLNISLHQYLSLSKDDIASWTCPTCCNVTRRHRGDRDNTPVRSTVIPTSKELASCSLAESGTSHQDPDWRSFQQELQSMLNAWRQDMDCSLSKIRGDIHNALTDIKNEIHALRTEQDNMKIGLAGLTNDVTELKAAAQFQAEEHSDLKKKFRDLDAVKGDRSDAMNLVTTMECKIDSLEQHARQCNVEICNVPDKRNENLMGILETLCTQIKYTVQQRDIISIHRVPHANQQNNRPKNIIVKFTTRIIRDNVLSAFRKTRGLKSDQLGITGQPHNIYMNEHLTLKNKQLFRECRGEAKKHKYKYVWVKNATILVRRTDTSPAFVVRSSKDLSKFKNTGNTSDNMETGM